MVSGRVNAPEAIRGSLAADNLTPLVPSNTELRTLAN